MNSKYNEEVNKKNRSGPFQRKKLTVRAQKRVNRDNDHQALNDQNNQGSDTVGRETQNEDNDESEEVEEI